MKESYVKYTGDGMKCLFETFSVKPYGENKEMYKFKTLKLDERHWYSLCVNKNENCSMKKNCIENIF